MALEMRDRCERCHQARLASDEAVGGTFASDGTAGEAGRNAEDAARAAVPGR